LQTLIVIGATCDKTSFDPILRLQRWQYQQQHGDMDQNNDATVSELELKKMYLGRRCQSGTHGWRIEPVRPSPVLLAANHGTSRTIADIALIARR
jgi:hypothetical protein